MPAAAGMVRIHAITMLPATPQRTADVPRVVPTPMIAPVIVCVVDVPRSVGKRLQLPDLVVRPIDVATSIRGFSVNDELS